MNIQSQNTNRNLLVYGCDDAYYEMTRVSLASFLAFNDPEQWEIAFLDVGLSLENKERLSALGAVYAYPPSLQKQFGGRIFPAGLARIAMLRDLVPDEPRALLYSDSDSLYFGSVQPLWQAWSASARPFALAEETTPDFYSHPMRKSWKESQIPEYFRRRNTWRDAPVLNTGLLLCRGLVPKLAGALGTHVHQMFGERIMWAEQTVLGSVIYEESIPFFPIPLNDHCYVFEEKILHQGAGEPYVDTIPYYDGQPITMRHFCARRQKPLLQKLLPALREKYGLTA